MVGKSESSIIGSAEKNLAPDEDALQDWIEEAYRNQGFKCYNWHKRERINEKGMDIECDSTREKVALAVKIRPKKGDISQLKRFSLVTATRRLYVYWNPPTREFQLQLAKTNVEPLTGQKLEDFLVEHASVGYLKWRFIKTDPLRLVVASISEVYECERVPTRKFAKTDLELIWRMKSSAVKLKADIRLVKNYFGDIILRQRDPAIAAQFTRQAQDFFQMIKADADEFYEIISRARKEAPHILRVFINHVSNRTGGVDLHAALQTTEGSKRDIAIENWLVEDKDVHKFLSALTWLNITLENLEDRFSLLSQGVDWVFEDALSELWGLTGSDLSDE